MMTNRSRRFFDLGEAVRLTRKIATRARSGEAAGTDSPLRESRLAEEGDSGRPSDPPPPASGLSKPETGTVENATELWRALLSWTRTETAAKGAFALDQRGFLIASVGTLDPFPPEIFSETFAAATRLFDTYLSETQGIASVSLEFLPIGRFAIFPLKVDAASVLLGIAGEPPLDTSKMSQICETIVGEIAAFDHKTDTLPKDGKPPAGVQDEP